MGTGRHGIVLLVPLEEMSRQKKKKCLKTIKFYKGVLLRITYLPAHVEEM